MTRRPGGVIWAASVAALLGACSGIVPTTTFEVNGWTVTCTTADLSVCRSAALAGIQFVFQARPTGVVSVTDRPTCPPATALADASHCWEIAIPVGSERACIIVARYLRAPDEMEILAGDAPGVPPIGRPVACA